VEEVRTAIGPEQLPPAAVVRVVLHGRMPSNCRVVQVLSEDCSLETMTQRCLQLNTSVGLGAAPCIRIEQIPNEQLNLDKDKEILLPVAHFSKEPTHMFGVPFLIAVRQGEPFGAVRSRIQSMLDVPDKEFDKYKFALVVNNKAKYMDDCDSHTVNLNELSTHAHNSMHTQGSFAPLPWLGLDHMNKTRAARSHPLEKAIVIHN
jgi:hypothetical protein